MSSTDTYGDDPAASRGVRGRQSSPAASGDERSRTSDELGTDSALLDGLIAGAPHAMAVTEGPRHVIRRMNPAFCRLMSTTADAVRDRAYGEVFYEPAGEGPLALMDGVLRSGEAVQDHEIARPRGADGFAVWTYTVWPLRGRACEVVGLVVEAQDRTHEAESTRRLQEMADQIRQINERLLSAALREQDLADQAQAAARAKAGFLSMMSHELRTPLSGIVGYTEVLAGGMLGAVTDRQRDSLDRISQCSAHLLEMIDDVLSFAQAEAQSLHARPERVDVNEIAREVAAIIEPLTLKKGLGLDLEIPDAPLPVVTDPQKVRQILLNLLGNAVKFTDEGRVRLDVGEEADVIRLRVRDTGIGIPPEDLDRIFEPFVQSEAVMTRRFGGTGLGLPISRALVTVLGGGLTAESTPGVGSTFTVHLPRAPAAPVAAE